MNLWLLSSGRPMRYSPYRSQLRSLLIQRSKMAIVMVVVVVHVAAASLDLGRTGYTSKQPLRRYPEVEASAVEAAVP